MHVSASTHPALSIERLHSLLPPLQKRFRARPVPAAVKAAPAAAEAMRIETEARRLAARVRAAAARERVQARLEEQ